MAHLSQAPPNGWSGHWPPSSNMIPPGFPGPPPAPQSGPVPPNWHSGHWQFNPNGTNRPSAAAVNTGIQGIPRPGFGAPPAQITWAPSDHWSSQAMASAQQGDNFNPYKKVSKAPEPSYYNYKLTDNGLGLEGMQPRRCVLIMVVSLCRKSNRVYFSHQEDDDTPQTPWIWNPPTLRESTQRPMRAREMPHSRSSLDSGTPQPHTRRASMDNHGRGSQSPQHMASGRRASHDAYQNHTFTDPKIPGFVPNAHQSPSAQRPRTPHASSAGHATRKPESFTEKIELHPTFSPQIVRTPDHYHRKNIEATRQKAGIRGAQPMARQSSLPNNLPSSSLTSVSTPISGLDGFSDEPASVLSPLIGATPKIRLDGLEEEKRARTAPHLPTRSQTLSAIPEAPSSRETGRSYARKDEHFAPLAPPPGDSIYAPRQPSRSRATPHPRRENPLPSPPADIQRTTPTRQEPRPPGSRYQCRKGFWNRRGDHLTSDSFIVYAPEGKQYPSELRDYPANEFWNAVTRQRAPMLDRPELPSSLPQRGRPPKDPYESVSPV